MAEERQAQGMSTGAKIAIGCLVVFAAGCGLVLWKVGPVAKEMIALGTGMATEMQEVNEVSLEDARAMVDPAWTLESILSDPEGAKGAWVEITGPVIEDDGDTPNFGQQQQGGFLIGTIDEANDLFRVVMVMDVTNSATPAAGTEVRVLGKVMDTQMMSIIEDMIPESERGEMEDFTFVFLISKEWSAVEG